MSFFVRQPAAISAAPVVANSPISYSMPAITATSTMNIAAPTATATFQAGALKPSPYPVVVVPQGPLPATQLVANASAAPSSEQLWGGGCAWQFDKTAFKQWVKTAVEVSSSKERRELYAFLSECFLDADGDRDGLVSHEEFDFLVEKAAALPRRFGLAPSWPEMYGDISHRQQVRHTTFFEEMDKHRRGKIGMDDWIDYSMKHIAEKVRTMSQDKVDIQHLEKCHPTQFVRFCDVATSDRHSEEFKCLYEHLFKTFVESDLEEKGSIRFEQFDVLIEDAARAPRTLGLAPTTAQAYRSDQEKFAVRLAEFNAMDLDRSGAITFDKFLNWAMDHITEKVRLHKAGAGPPTAQQISMPVGCPMTGAVVGQCPMTYVQPAPAVTYAASPAVTYVEPAPAVQYVAPAPAVTYTAPAPAMTYVQPAPAVQYATSAPAVNYAAPAPAVTYSAPMSPYTTYLR